MRRRDEERPSAGAGEFDDTPDGFGRIAASTARQVIVQRLRDLEDEQILGDFKGREGDVVSGVIQQSRDPRTSWSTSARSRAMLPLAEQVPGERYVHGERLRCFVVSVRKRGAKGPQVGLSRTHPNLVRKLFALEVPEIADGTVEIAALAREAGHRTKIAVRTQGRRASTPRAPASARWAPRVRAVMTELHGEKIDIVDYADDPADVRRGRAVAGPGAVGRDRRRRGPVGPGRRARLPAVAGDRQGGPERPPGGQAHRLADRHPPRHRPRRGAEPADGARPRRPDRAAEAERRAVTRPPATGRRRGRLGYRGPTATGRPTADRRCPHAPVSAVAGAAAGRHSCEWSR